MTAEFEVIDGFQCYAPHLALAFDDYPSAGFDVTAEVEDRSFWCRTRNRVLRQVFTRFVDSSRRIEMLEIGCGIGGVLKELRTLPNLSLTGSEIYLKGLRYARERIPDVKFIQVDATTMPFNQAFDVIGAFDVLEHVVDDVAVIARVREALRPGGKFVITVPQYQWMWSRLDEVVEHKRRYSRADMVGKLRAAGFTIEYTTSFVTVLFPLMVAQRFATRRQERADTRQDFTEEVVLPKPINSLFDMLMRIDEFVLRLGGTLPFGGSLLVVASRP
jgi:SAM-dependent methyltransferase